MDNSWLVSESDQGSSREMADKFFVDLDGTFTVIVDPKNVSPIIKRYFKICSLLALISRVESSGYNTQYKFASKEEKKFLESIKSISHDSRLLQEKVDELNKHLPSLEEINSVPSYFENSLRL